MLSKYAAVCTLACAAVSAHAHETDAIEVATHSAGTAAFVQYQLPQANGPTVEYFISKTRQPAPLILMIQGSGCVPVFSGLGTPAKMSHMFNYIDWVRTEKYAVMVVNKPYAPATPPAGQGTATACPDQFNQYFTLENWVRDLRRAFDHAQQLPWVKPGPVLVVGISEGGTVATALAAADQRVTNVALLGSSGPSQLYDFVLNAYSGSSSDEETSRKLDELEQQRQRIMAAPDSARDFAWGHPFKRWASFFRASSTGSLLKSHARVYIASGMRDASVPVLSTESMASELVAAGHDVTMRRVPNAGHDLIPAGGNFDALAAEYARILAWFEQNK